MSKFMAIAAVANMLTGINKFASMHNMAFDKGPNIAAKAAHAAKRGKKKKLQKFKGKR
jgi:hypothetical protein